MLVTRKLYDLAVQRGDEFHEAYIVEQGAHALTRSQLVALTEKLSSLQRAGFTTAQPEPPFPLTQRMDPEIKSALDGRFPGNSPHRAMVLKQIEEWTDAGREPTWIARRIWDGEESVDG